MEEALARAKAWAREMMTGRLEAVEGARRIAGDVAAGAGGDLGVFADLARAWDADEAGRAGCEARILDEAAKLLADTA